MQKYFIIFFLCSFITVYSQDEVSNFSADTSSNQLIEDSNFSADTISSHLFDGDKILAAEESKESIDFDDFSFLFYSETKEHPFIEFYYGSPKLEGRAFSSSFKETGIAEVRLGYTSGNINKAGVYRLKQSFVSISSVSANLKSKSSTVTELQPELWHAGFGLLDGYGYKIGQFSIGFYNANSVGWSHYQDNNMPVHLSDEDKLLADHYNKTVRFGSAAEGGIKIKIASAVSLNTGYERSIIFPGYVFWEHITSMLLEYGSIELLNSYIKSVNSSSTYATPIVNFILKNALSYGLYSLRSEKMNWPFEGASPLTVNTWKIGLSMNF